MKEQTERFKESHDQCSQPPGMHLLKTADLGTLALLVVNSFKLHLTAFNNCIAKSGGWVSEVSRGFHYWQPAPVLWPDHQILRDKSSLKGENLASSRSGSNTVCSLVSHVVMHNLRKVSLTSP